MRRICPPRARSCCSTAAGTTARAWNGSWAFVMMPSTRSSSPAPEFEKMLARSGIQIIKYWFSVSDNEQEARFESRINDPLKQWKLSPMDLESRRRWEAYTQAKEVMLERTTSLSRPGGSCGPTTRKGPPELHHPPVGPGALSAGGSPGSAVAGARASRGLPAPSRARARSCRTAIELAGACLPTVTFRRHHPDPRAGRNGPPSLRHERGS